MCASLLAFLILKNFAISAVLAAVSLLILRFSKRIVRRSETSELLMIAHTLELLAAVYTLTGSIKQAVYYMCQRDYPLSKNFISALSEIRNGSDPVHSIMRSLEGNPRYINWFGSLIGGSTHDAKEILSLWRCCAEEAILKIDDILSFIIVSSTFLPTILAIILMVFGASPPLLYLLVIVQPLLFQVVYRWIGKLLSLIC